MQKTIATVIAAFALQAGVVHAQDLWNTTFRAVCKPSGNSAGNAFNGVNGMGNGSRMTDADLIAQCVGTGFTAKQLRRSFAVVYNPSADSIQVVNRTNGEAVCDVFQFQGGTAVTNGDRLIRFTFVFSPAQTDAIGSAIITERATTTGSGGTSRAHIVGKIQFAEPSALLVTGTEAASANTGTDQTNSAAIAQASTNIDNSSNTNGTTGTGNGSSTGNGGSSGNGPTFLAATADVTATNSAVQICRGTFVVSRPFTVGTASAASTKAARIAARRAAKQAKAAAKSNTSSTANTANANAANTAANINANANANANAANAATTTTVVSTNSTTVSTNTTIGMTPPAPSF